MKSRNSAQREEPVLELNNLHQRILSTWTKEHGISYVEFLYKSNFLEDKAMTIYSPVSLLPQRSVSVATSTCVKTSNDLLRIQLIVEEWLHNMCKKDFFAQKPFGMTWFCAIVQWSSSSSILSHHTVTLSTTVPCHQLKCTWRSCSRLSIWLHWENLLFLALQSLQWTQCYECHHQKCRTDQITAKHSVITFHHLSYCLKALLHLIPLTIFLLQYPYYCPKERYF